MGKYCFNIIKPEYYESIREYREEMLAADSPFDGCSMLEDYEDIEKWHLNCKLFESKDTLPPLYSIGFEYLYICDGQVVGMLNFRPEAMDHPMLKVFGGHIGYSIKPSFRRKGIGTRMLKDFLPVAREYGLDRVLITCHEHNEGSRNIIVANGGIKENSVYFKPDNCNVERYYISL